jgi:hypothetical protein
MTVVDVVAACAGDPTDIATISNNVAAEIVPIANARTGPAALLRCSVSRDTALICGT